MELFGTAVFSECLTLATLLFAAYGIGSCVPSRFSVVKLSFGLAVTAFAGWCFSELSAAVCIIYRVIFGAAAIWGIYAAAKDFRQNRFFFAVAGVFFLLIFGSCILFPYGWDECVYQTALLKHYIINGNNCVMADNPFSGFPSLPHSIMRLCMTAGKAGIRFPRLLSGAVISIAIAGVWVAAAKCGSRKALFFAAAGTLSPVVLVLARANYAEQYILLFAVAGALSVFEKRNQPVICAVLTSLFAAAALSVKLTGAGVVIALGILYLAVCKKRNFLTACGAGAAVFTVFVLPFFLRTYLAAGNPFFPFCNRIFSNDIAVNLVSDHHHLLGSYRYGTGWLSGICYGWIFTASDPKIYDGISCGWQFPLMFFLAAALTVHLCKIASGRKKTSLVLLVCSFSLYIFWAFSSQQSRFMLPLIMLNVVLCSFALKALPGKTAVCLGAAVLTAALLPFPSNHIKHFYTAWKIAPEIGKDPIRFLAAATRDPGYFEVAKFLESTPSDSRVLLLLNERRTLYLPGKVVIGEPFFQPLNTPIPSDKNQLWNNIKDFDFIVVSTSDHDPDAQQTTRDDMVRMAELFAALREDGKFQLVFSDSRGEYFIFRCGDTATGAAPATSSRNSSNVDSRLALDFAAPPNPLPLR